MRRSGVRGAVRVGPGTMDAGRANTGASRRLVIFDTEQQSDSDNANIRAVSAHGERLTMRMRPRTGSRPAAPAADPAPAFVRLPVGLHRRRGNPDEVDGCSWWRRRDSSGRMCFEHVRCEWRLTLRRIKDTVLDVRLIR